MGLREFYGGWSGDRKSGVGYGVWGSGKVKHFGVWRDDWPDGFGVKYGKDGTIEKIGEWKEAAFQRR